MHQKNCLVSSTAREILKACCSLNIRSLFLNRNSKQGVTSVFSFPSFTVSSILLRWYGLFYFILILSTDINCSTGDGLNTDIEMCTKQDLIKQRKPHMNALTHAPRMLSSSSSTTLGVSWMPTNKVWQGMWQNGPCRSRNCTGESDSAQCCQ